MNYNIIRTGSMGNAVVIGGSILLDCGVSFAALREVYRDIKLVLLTHIHSDHFNKTTIRILAAERPTLRFGCGKWLAGALLDCGVAVGQIDILDIGKRYDYGAFSVSPVKLYHDVPNVGYRVFLDGEKLLYATDTATLAGIIAKGYDLYMVEANYETDKVIAAINEKAKTGEYAYEWRVLRQHMSKEDCDAWLADNMGPDSKYIYMHQHHYEDGERTANEDDGQHYVL